ncbi:MAG: hypothetical protein HYV36_02510 [Lentisphaerae bacterium]|nr:hypothetical protein [Lentisphaerota bacterium]
MMNVNFLSIKLTIALIAIALFIGLFAAAGLANAPAAITNATPRVENFSSGPVELVMTADPPRVHLPRDILLSIKIKAPTNIMVRLPALDDRFSGFALSGAFEREPIIRNDAITREHCFRLTPLIAAEYRLAPIAVTYTDTSGPKPLENWFATRALVFEVAPLGSGQPGTSIRDIRPPVWIYPAFTTVAGWAGAGALAAAAFWALYRLARRLQRAIRLLRMSPRERALRELADLMQRDLIAQNQVKEFFLELTGIVRRYIERAHRIRAPEQTTEEFLLAASYNPRFHAEVLGKLRAFLQTADLVKFAVYRPEPAIIDRALGTARDYIETDNRTLTTEDRRRTTRDAWQATDLSRSERDGG